VKQKQSLEKNTNGKSRDGKRHHLSFTYDDNRLLGNLFGQFDQNIALIEQKLNVVAHISGNHVNLHGDARACEQAKRVLDELYVRVRQGHTIAIGDVEGVIRHVIDQGVLFETPDEAASAKSTGNGEFSQISTRRKTLVARTRAQDDYIRALNSKTMVFATGPAGTGKTYLAVAYAAMLLERGTVERILLSRPAVEAGERLGFLPGDMREKVDPYLRPLYDALYDMMPPDRVERGLQTQTIEIAPLAFMRGRTLTNAAIILDEAQNTTVMQMKMFLTRLGENSKMIITGDPSQVDLPSGQQSGLAQAVSILHSIDDIALIEFKDTDIVRHELVAKIVRAYDASAKARRP
jgi:phosphate starvation-inducible PhoH-like protein